MKKYFEIQRQQEESITKMEASVSMLEKAYVELDKAYVMLRQDIKVEKDKNKKRKKFMVKMWKGIKAIFKWNQMNKFFFIILMHMKVRSISSYLRKREMMLVMSVRHTFPDRFAPYFRVC